MTIPRTGIPGRLMLLALLAVTAVLTAAIAAQDPANAANQNGEFHSQNNSQQAPSKANLKQVDCQDPHYSICIQWSNGGRDWPHTRIRVYDISASRPAGNPFFNTATWESSRVRDLTHNGWNHSNYVISGLKSEAHYLVTVEGENNGNLEGIGVHADMPTTAVQRLLAASVKDDCANPHNQVCLEWQIQHQDGRRFEITTLESDNAADISGNTLDMVINHLHSITAVKDATARSHTVTGLTPGKWYRFEVRAQPGGPIWTEPQQLPADPSHTPAPQCVARFDTDIPDIARSRGTIGMLIACPKAMNLKDQRRYHQTEVRVRSLDRLESYQYTFNALAMNEFIAMPGIRDGKEYRLEATAIYKSALHGTERSATSVELHTYSADDMVCRTCPAELIGAVRSSIATQWPSVLEDHGETKFTVSLSRPLRGSEMIELPVTISGGEPDDHWNVELRAEDNGPGVRRSAPGKNSEVVFTSGGQVATFTLIGRPDDDTDDRVITIEIGGPGRKTTTTNLPYGTAPVQGEIRVTVIDSDSVPPGYTVKAQVIADVKALAAQTQHGFQHVNRWNRVLWAFGEHDGTGVAGGAMTAAQAQQMAAAHSSPVWDDVVTELTNLEASP